MKYQLREFKQAVTLIELLVVISILAVISGIGMAFFSHSNRQLDFQSTSGEIISIIRFARSAARTEKMPTRVVIDPVKKEIYCFKRQILGLWHFEDTGLAGSTGAFNRSAELAGGAELTPDGKFGQGVNLPGFGLIDCGDIPVVFPDQGLEIEAWVYLFETEQSRNQTIMVKAGEYRFEIAADRGLFGRFDQLVVNSRSGIVPLNRWVRLRLVYDQEVLQLFINKQKVAERSGSASLKDDKSSLTVSSHAYPLNGKVDEIKISAIVKGRRFKLQPSDVNISSRSGSNGLIVLQFDERGRLNYSQIRIKFESPSVRSSFELKIDSFGNVKME